MLFSEIYSCYYNAVAAILGMATEKKLTGKTLRDAVTEQAFEESVLFIPDALKSERWPLLTKELETPLHQKPTMPMTILQKQWLKALLLDPRISLFSPNLTGLENIEPLYGPEMLVSFDRYEDGDSFQDRRYIENFQLILRALRENRNLDIHYRNAHGRERHFYCMPIRLEYSVRDDKFRLYYAPDPDIALRTGHLAEQRTANLSRILNVELKEVQEEKPEVYASWDEELVLELTDERGAMQRAMMAFSDFEKDTIRTDEMHYCIHLWYKREDETDLLIRILSFGPMVKVKEPKELADQIWARLRKQKEYGL